LGVIVSSMAIAVRDLNNNPREWRGVDAVALGFINEIGDNLQAAVAALAVTRLALDQPNGELASMFKARVDSGKILCPSRGEPSDEKGDSIEAGERHDEQPARLAA
jgi:hypothetical protein